MSKLTLQKYKLMCKRFAAECTGLAADVPDPDLKAHFLHSQHVDGTGGSTPCPALVDDAGVARVPPGYGSPNPGTSAGAFQV
jgi:hypothetical protein